MRKFNYRLLLIIFGVIVISSLFVVMIKLAANLIHPLQFLSLSLLLSAVISFLFSHKKTRRDEIKTLLKWKYLTFAVLLTATIQGLWFVGISLTSANNASLINKTELIFTFLILCLLLRKETFSIYSILGVVIVTLGLFVITFNGYSNPNIGDLILILTMTLLPFGNHLQLMARTIASSLNVICVRYFFSGLILFIISFSIFEIPSIDNLIKTAPLILFQGIFWFTLNMYLWTELIYEVKVSKGLIITSFSSVLTFLWAYLLLDEILSLNQIIGFILILIGTYFTIKDFKHDLVKSSN